MWIFGRLSPIPHRQTHSQTLKDRATQLLRSRSGALVKQFILIALCFKEFSLWNYFFCYIKDTYNPKLKGLNLLIVKFLLFSFSTAGCDWSCDVLSGTIRVVGSGHGVGGRDRASYHDGTGQQVTNAWQNSTRTEKSISYCQFVRCMSGIDFGWISGNWDGSSISLAT